MAVKRTALVLNTTAAAVITGRRLAAVVLTESADTEPVRHRQEGVEVLLFDVHLAVIHKVQDGRQISQGDVLKVKSIIGTL